MNRNQMIEAVIRLIAPVDLPEFRKWLEKLDDWELEREYREVSEAFESNQPA